MQATNGITNFKRNNFSSMQATNGITNLKRNKLKEIYTPFP
jgi:hypothetical protein